MVSKTLVPMTKEELINWLDLNEYGENYSHYMPNEIFEDIVNEKQLKSLSMKAFAYAYYYLSTYAYGNAIYTKDLSNYRVIDFCRAIGVKSHEHYGFITKRGGVLDKMGYTISTTDYPVFVNRYDNNGSEIIFYTTASQEAFNNDYPKLPKNSFIKYPVKAFTRNEEYKKIYGDLCGTFYISENTHLISIETFVDIVTNNELGYTGFYIFSFISMMYDRYKKNGYIESCENIGKQIGASKNTSMNYLRKLKEYGFISTKRTINKNTGLHYENAYFIHDKYNFR